ncbi:MAG TPA: SdpI family protein [Verrucomicrobiae bacterium]|jgi:uncharacterized membrane protein
MKLLKNEWLQLLILAAPFCVVALLWDKLPERIPIHWNARGDINGYSGKAFGLWLMPIINIFIAILLGWLPRIDPRFKKTEGEAGASMARVFKIIRLVITGFNAGVEFAILAFALHYHFDMTRFMVGSLALLFIILGNLMNKVRPNYFVGIRTPWTLESRTVWLKTHRLGGRTMVAAGICMLLGMLVLPAKYLIWWDVLPISILSTMIPAGYSFFCYQAEKKNPEMLTEQKPNESL